MHGSVTRLTVTIREVVGVVPSRLSVTITNSVITRSWHSMKKPPFQLALRLVSLTARKVHVVFHDMSHGQVFSWFRHV
jgi:hypothetical protein